MDPVAATVTTESTTLVARYKQLRAVSIRLHERVMKILPKEAVTQGGRRLGILQRGTLVFDSDDETAVLFDYCLYNVRVGGLTAIQRFADSQPALTTDEALLLDAMQRVEYGLWVVERAERGLGVAAKNLWNQETCFISDLGLGTSGKPGLAFGARVLSVDGLAMTTGATLAVGDLTSMREEQRAAFVRTSQPGSDGDPGLLIQVGLEKLRSHAARRHSGSVPRLTRETEKAGRNSPCPCGSGKKYKQCCLGRD